MKSDSSKTACITGATSGIGAAFAKKFAQQGYDLIITGRRKEEIDFLSRTLSKESKINVEVMIAELSDDKCLDLLVEKIKNIKNLTILVNNAGFTKENFFHKEDFSTYEVMSKVHNFAVIKLCHIVLPNMISNGNGTIINVSSLGAFAPLPINAVYSASKSFINFFTESIHLELKGTGVKVQALCPGMTKTDFHEKLGYDKNTYYKDKGRRKAMTPEEVVNISLQNLEKDKVFCIPGRHNQISCFLLKMLPRKIIHKMGSSFVNKFRD
ncbi:MAG: SDR family oxidoreductase [Deltaproteobacteria bacterium]|nr:SDR family oxidoreductase [Deltaproteobacteria bacterium]NNK86513.1 SDR family oxidoreductase [Desulfobacterales bacterium]